MLSESLETTTAAGDVYFTGVVPDVIGRFTLEMALMAQGQEIAVKLYYTEGRVTTAWAKSFIDGYVRIATCLAGAPTRSIEAAIDSIRRVDSLSRLNHHTRRTRYRSSQSFSLKILSKPIRTIRAPSAGIAASARTVGRFRIESTGEPRSNSSLTAALSRAW